MHYYNFNIGDYRSDTAHLSLLEHGIYRQLLDSYYLSEKPIETQSVMRRLSIRTEDEKTAFENVISDFFELSECGCFYIHGRINAEITKYKEKADIARVNGGKGGRPKKPKKTQSVNSGLAKETQGKANQEPITNNQEPITNKKNEQKKEGAGVTVPAAPRKTISRFVKPSLREASEYFLELGSQVCQDDANNFIDHFDSNGWKVGGRASMKDWRAAIRKWFGNSRKYSEAKNNENKSRALNGRDAITFTDTDF